MTIYDRYCCARDSKGLKDSQVASKTQIGRSTFSDWKSGRSIPKAEKLQKIADFLNISFEWLTTGEEKEINLKCNGLEGFQALLADIYGSCEMEGVMGEYGECIYFSVGTGKNRYALEENDFDRLYNSVKNTIQQMADLLLKDERIVRFECQKAANVPPILCTDNKNAENLNLSEQTRVSSYTTNDPKYVNAAHPIDESSEEDKQFDEGIMNDENF